MKYTEDHSAINAIDTPGIRYLNRVFRLRERKFIDRDENYFEVISYCLKILAMMKQDSGKYANIVR